ncbi:MAG: hypothetical protein Q4G43_12510 [Mobilicoccus sp.]|nr:hypothetical protein [Mobilicoccus sp.]
MTDGSVERTHEDTLDALHVGLDGAIDLLDTERRAWIIGVGWLSGVAPTREAPDVATVDGILAWTRTTSLFPSGAMRFVEDDQVEFLAADVSSMKYRHRDPRGQDFLEVLAGFGPYGFVATGMTRSGNLGAERDKRSHVLLTDLEATCVDLLVLSRAAAEAYHYDGPIDLLVGVSSLVPGEQLALRCFDPATGDLTPEADAARIFDPVHTRVSASGSDEARYERLFDLAVEAARQFGQDRPQFMLAPEIAVGDRGSARDVSSIIHPGEHADDR